MARVHAARRKSRAGAGWCTRRTELPPGGRPGRPGRQIQKSSSHFLFVRTKMAAYGRRPLQPTTR